MISIVALDSRIFKLTLVVKSEKLINTSKIFLKARNILKNSISVDMDK